MPTKHGCSNRLADGKKTGISHNRKERLLALGWEQVSYLLILPIKITWLTSSALEFTRGPYRSSRKEPDWFLRMEDQRLPTLVLESGWSETYHYLLDDLNASLLGGNGAIKSVVILNWTKVPGTQLVQGTVEHYVPGQNRIPVLWQREACTRIFVSGGLY